MNKKVISSDQLGTIVKGYVDRLHSAHGVQLADHDARIHTLEREMGKHELDLLEWGEMKADITAGYHKDYFEVGEQATFEYDHNGTKYACPVNIVSLKEMRNAHGELKNALTLEWEYAYPTNTAFDPVEAMIELKDTLVAGTYNFKVNGDSWASQNGKTYQFTTNSNLPAGTQLRPSSSHNTSMAGANMLAYSDGKSQTVIGSFQITEGSTGQFLGTMWGTDTPNDMKTVLKDEGGHFINHYHRVFLGYNRWKNSYIRQFLNSEGTGWWRPQNVWDRAPSEVDSIKGFMDGLPTDMKEVIRETQVITPCNTVTDGGVIDTTYDKIYLASKKQMCWSVDGDESQVEEWEYYRELANEVLGDGKSWANYQTYPELIRYSLNAKTSPQYIWKRSAFRGHGYYVWLVFTSGGCSSASAIYGYRFLPACSILGE